MQRDVDAIGHIELSLVISGVIREGMMCRTQMASSAAALSSCSGGVLHNSERTEMCLGIARAGSIAGMYFSP